MILIKKIGLDNWILWLLKNDNNYIHRLLKANIYSPIMRVIGVIPARYASSRFPGKPLADICGKPMVWWVYNNMSSLDCLDDLIVATDDEKIVDVCKQYNMKVMLTSTNHETGTDRVVEVSEKIDGDLYVVIMGDEPLIKAEDVSQLVDLSKNSMCDACMLTTKFVDPVDAVNTTTIKLALNDDNDVIFMSRLPIPYPKSAIGYELYKNMGAYAFTKNALNIFKNTNKGRIERAEDLEMLRLIEKHCIVKALIVSSDSMSVDTKKDLERIRRLISEKMSRSCE